MNSTDSESMTPSTRISFADAQTVKCPFPAYQTLQRDNRTVYLDPMTRIYEVTGVVEIKKAAADVTTFSNLMNRQSGLEVALQQQILELYAKEGFVPIPTLLNNDGVDHKRFRSLVDRAFTTLRINALLPTIRSEVDCLLNDCNAAKEIEFVRQFAIPLPLNIICDLMGVARTDNAAVKAGSDAMLAVADPLTPPGLMLSYVRDIIRLQKLLADRLKKVRVVPDETIFSVVANSEVDGEYLSVGMMVNLFQNIMVAGNETTTNALANCLLLLMEDPALCDRLRADPDPGKPLVRNFVEEALRLRAPLQGFFRVVTKDTELGGVAIPAGALVMLRWGAGGLDESQYPCPNELQLDRKAIAQHTTFGHGVHFCIGNQLARAELREAVDAILKRWPRVRLSPRDNAVVTQPSFITHGPRDLYIRVD